MRLARTPPDPAPMTNRSYSYFTRFFLIPIGVPIVGTSMEDDRELWHGADRVASTLGIMPTDGSLAHMIDHWCRSVDGL